MERKFFRAYGFLLWLLSKIAVTILIVIPLFATPEPTVHTAALNIQLAPSRAAVSSIAEAGPTEPQMSEIPDPEPPTTDGPWSNMVSSNPSKNGCCTRYGNMWRLP